jgi:hypothetical protein
MPPGQNHSNFALKTGLSAPRYDTWCKIQVFILLPVFYLLPTAYCLLPIIPHVITVVLAKKYVNFYNKVEFDFY